uniref:Uncharacterized protein n=1 Tax=Tetraselmis chuii TaxID=63592 RepID=A0A7S1T2K1_9CHLO|mmetsp:Transcript_42302/g.75909  ORF Transcript_42302/g.75909 Transcript_42302/m.75909 type:complete len:150 (+) Transcript_42302:250-699(+)|eukprot:CAMPEP_0177769036 /NCGR_PEP_ID=MMETSP0491_2-20121128/10084_1 /TAXON_ID=63592 /ORGANISM="Tetraselmis chuii, Strain PLY429" /LENGTH=149 /DNA_ID=CAMNT_0019285971 /DNA_START=309 /DNA_END=758 /DNA_ORIENTATION=+
MDSVAAVQAALTGATTLFPLILCGHVKGRVMLLYKELEREFGAAGKANLASAAAALRLGMSSLPTDVVHQPRDTDAICNRLLAMLPTRSPFALVADCERKVALLKAQVSVISNDDNKLGRTFSQTRAKGFQRGVMHNLLHPTKSNGHAT